MRKDSFEVGQQVYKLYCGGMTLVTVVAIHPVADMVRVQYEDGRRRYIDADRIMEAYDGKTDSENRRCS